MEDCGTEITITTPDGKGLSEEEVKELLKTLQHGVVHIPQQR